MAHHLTEDQRDEYVALFRRYDVDGDGRIDREELRQALREAAASPSEATLDSSMAALDDNGDGTLDLDEFLAGMAIFHGHDRS